MHSHVITQFSFICRTFYWSINASERRSLKFGDVAALEIQAYRIVATRVVRTIAEAIGIIVGTCSSSCRKFRGCCVGHAYREIATLWPPGIGCTGCQN